MRSGAPKSSPVTSAYSIPRKPPASRERDIKRKGNLINDKRNTPNFRLKEKYKAFRIFICFIIILYIVGMASRWRTMTELAGSHFPLTPRPVVAHPDRDSLSWLSLLNTNKKKQEPPTRETITRSRAINSSPATSTTL